MFWRERERETKDQNGGLPSGQIRVLVVGDSGIFIYYYYYSSLFCASMLCWVLCCVTGLCLVVSEFLLVKICACNYIRIRGAEERWNSWRLKILVLSVLKSLWEYKNLSDVLHLNYLDVSGEGEHYGPLTRLPFPVLVLGADTSESTLNMSACACHILWQKCGVRSVVYFCDLFTAQISNSCTYLLGVGKTSLVHLIVKGCSTAHPPQTIGCTVGVKHITYGNSSSSSNSIKGDSERDFFVELWDISGHERYKDCRSLFYSQINGIIFVHDLSQRRTKTSLQKWAAEIAASGTFSAPLGSGGPGGLLVPYIVIGNKADVAAKEGTRGSSGNLVEVARQWVEKQGLLPTSEELPLTESFPGSGSAIAAAKEARYDKEAVIKFFRMVCAIVFVLPIVCVHACCSLYIYMYKHFCVQVIIGFSEKSGFLSHQLIRRRYFSDESPAQNQWSISPVQKPIQRLDENFNDEDPFYKSTSLSGDSYKYNNMLPPLPAQLNLTPPPTLYPQQPVSVPENYSLPRFAFTGSSEISSTARSKRSDINV
ncbi:hypothetical protein EZV62_000336 [Acer yangbiense]|uniref:Uncharacterized protein n=1 Tax=Acer yangbiense TaxID=1000413 RepID=A0A5C7IQS3_9ROSI|nr:hypothetical protein EZV62_000336 [Acer yangbiense]